MNQKILQKVLDNLNTEKPDLSYIRGMIETLLALGEPKEADNYTIVPNTMTNHSVKASGPMSETGVMDEGAILDAQARAATAAVAELTGKTVETA